jgi:Tfp pilus assembly protein PilF
MPLAATGALALLAGWVAVAPAKAQQPAAAAAGQAPAKNYKDRAEYDLYSKVTTTTDPKARLEVLNTWQDKYPQSDYAPERLAYYLDTLSRLAPTDPSQRQALLNKCQEALKSDPKNPTALFFISFWGPAVGGASPSPELQTQVDSAAHAFISGADEAFAPANKPQNLSEADFAKTKKIRVGVAHKALAWVATAKKDNTTAESEYKASLTTNPDQGPASAEYARLLYDEKKIPEALFQYARASQFDGPGALPPATRTQLLDFFNKAYKGYKGNSDGADQLLAQAKTAALPPDGFTIASASDAAKKEADTMNKRMDSDPAFKLWYTIKSNLIGDQADKFFTDSVKDTEIPAGAEGVKNFSGTVISIDPADKPTKVVLGVEDPAKGDATLLFSQPLPASALDTIKVGGKLEFDGVADSFTKDPYMLTFKDPTVPGVQTTAPAKKGTARKRR